MTEQNRTEDQKREELTRALEERGVENVDKLLWEVGDDINLDAMLAALSRADREGMSSIGLLVYRVKEAAKSRFRRPEERKSVEGGASAEITPTLLRAIRGTCNSPNGITREEAAGVFAHKAARMETTADALIDEAMGPDWTGTPPHPALDPTNPHKAAEYIRWVGS